MDQSPWSTYTPEEWFTESSSTLLSTLSNSMAALICLWVVRTERLSASI